MKEVYSSAVDSIGYDEETQSLHVRWARTGRISVYQGVPPELADETMRAPSIGQAMKAIQDSFPHRYI